MVIKVKKIGKIKENKNKILCCGDEWMKNGGKGGWDKRRREKWMKEEERWGSVPVFNDAEQE